MIDKQLLIVFVIIILLLGLLIVFFLVNHKDKYTFTRGISDCKDFQNKMVIITGGTTGIGLATAIAFAKQGALVQVGGRSKWKWDNVSIPCIVEKYPELIGSNNEPKRIIYHTLDVRNEDNQYTFFNDAWNLSKQLGSPRLDVVFNNAGVAVGSMFGLKNNTLKVSKKDQSISMNINTTVSKNCQYPQSPQWVFSGETIVHSKLDRTAVCKNSCIPQATSLASAHCENGIMTDQFGQMISCKMAVGFMRGNGYMNLIGDTTRDWGKGNPSNVHGVIINTSSINALIAAPGSMDYSISKSASLMLTKTLAVEQSTAFLLKLDSETVYPTIRVNTVLPGPVDTPLMRATVTPGFKCAKSYVPIILQNGTSIKPTNPDTNNGETITQDWAEAANNNWNQQLEAIYKQELNSIFAGTMPNNYMARPAEIATVVLFLADNKKSSFINGTSIIADGGMQTTWGTVPMAIPCPSSPQLLKMNKAVDAKQSKKDYHVRYN